LQPYYKEAVLTTSTTEKDNNESNILVQRRRLKWEKYKKDEEENIAGKLKNKRLEKTTVQRRNRKENKGDIKTSLVNVSSNKLDNEIIHST
jgi:IMP dehydrogenase/GMP reductase